MQQETKETYKIAIGVLIVFATVITLFSNNPLPEGYTPQEVKAYGLFEEARKRSQVTLTDLQKERCVEMGIEDCPITIVSAHSLGPKVMAYYCYRACRGGMDFSTELNEPHIVYRQTIIHFSSDRHVKGLISHELAHHIFQVSSGERSFKAICEKYDGIGCEDHPEEDTGNLLIFN